MAAQEGQVFGLRHKRGIARAYGRAWSWGAGGSDSGVGKARAAPMWPQSTAEFRTVVTGHHRANFHSVVYLIGFVSIVKHGNSGMNYLEISFMDQIRLVPVSALQQRPSADWSAGVF